MIQTIQLEAFNTELHGSRILLQGPFPPQKLPPVMEAVQRFRDPFKKRILLTQQAFSLSTYFPLSYDAVFQAKDTQDWQMILTYLTYGPKPSLVVVEDLPIPDGFWPKLPSTTTLIHCTTKPILHLRSYDTIFFASSEEGPASLVDYTFKILQTVYKSTYTLQEHREILQELRVAGAGIAWTRIKEDRPTGSLYWYDPVSVQQGEHIPSAHLAELLRWVANHIPHSHD